MNIAVVRKIDRWIGIPLCWIFTLIEKIIRAFRRSDTPPKNILFIELSEMGSAIIAYSALQKAKELFPKANVFFLIFDENKESVSLAGAIPREHVLTIRNTSLFTFLRDTLAVLWKMHGLRIDTAIDMELFSRASCLLAYLSGAQRRVGFSRFRIEGLYRGDLLTHNVSYNVYQHMALNFLNMVYALIAPDEENPKLKQHLADIPSVPRVESTNTEKARMYDKLKEIQPALKQTDRLIVFNPNAGLLPIRAWPLEKYVELAQYLTKGNNTVYIVVMGVNAAAQDAEEITRAIGGRCIDLTNKTTLREVIDLFNIADILVTNDSGPAHFASLTPIKNFVFFGPETPLLYGPLGEQAFPLFANYSCSPCLSAFNHRNTVCRDPQCVKGIPVQDVYKQITRELQRVWEKHVF